MNYQRAFANLLISLKSLILLFALTLTAHHLIVRAQSTNGSLTGVVSDEQGATVAGANVTVISVDRNQTEGSVQSTDDGNYNFPALIPGTYKLVVERDGFSRSEISPVIIELNVRQRVDAKLTIGSVGATVTVELDAAEQIERDSSAVGTVIGTEQVQNLPLFERSPTNLVALAPGVSAGFDSEGRLNTAQLSVNGSRTLNTEVTVDGVSTINGSTGDVSFVPSVESLREFRVQTATYSAEFGRTSGATISAIVASGTSRYRGSVYEYFRNEALNANNYFFNSRGIARPADRFNQFGGTFGGRLPMLAFGEGTASPITKLENTFFFFNYEGLRRTLPRQYTSSVPSQALRSGDFSGSAIVIRDPLTGQQVRDPARATAANPLGLNIIPLNRIDPAARAILNLLPQANLPGTQRNYFAVSSDRVRTNQGTLRIDHAFDVNARLFGRYSLRKGTDATFTPDASTILPGAINPGTGANQPVNHQLALGYNQTFSPTIFNELNVGFNRDVQAIDPPGAIDSPAALGFQRAPQSGVEGSSGFFAPAIIFPGSFYGFNGRLGANTNTLRRQNTNTYQINDAVSIVSGAHTIKLGVQARRNQLDIFNGGAQFSANYTINGNNLPGAPANSETTQLAAFLFGLVDSAVYQVPQPRTTRRNYNLGFFVQDDWKVTQRLTFNLGLRYDYESPLTIDNDVYSRIDPQTGRLLIAGANASRSLNLKADKNNFGPRVGFAYSLDDDTVIRGAYGLFYSQVFSNLGGSGALYPGFTLTQQCSRIGTTLPQTFNCSSTGTVPQSFSLSQGIPLLTSTDISDPFAAERNSSAARPLATGAQFAFISPLPEIHQWSLGIQRIVPFGITLDAAYVGTRGLHLPLDSTDFNSVPQSRFNDVAAQNTAQVTQNNRLFPNIGGLNAFENVGSSIYHSAQFKVTRRFAQGFGITANYTFSKSLDDGSGISNFSQPNGIDRGIIPTFRRDLDRSVSSFDRPHVFTGAFQAELPFGKGKMFFNDSSSIGGKVAGAILGGFQVNALVQARSGLPDTITLGNVSGIGTQFQPRPNIAPGGQLQTGFEPGPGGTVRYIQAPGSTNFPLSPAGPIYIGTGASRTQILPFSIGSLGRNTIRAPNSYNTDLSVIRRFRIRERTNLNIRAEAFNVFNQTTFLFDPAGSTTSLPVVVNSSNQAVFGTSNFGLIDRSLPARRLQLVARFEF